MCSRGVICSEGRLPHYILDKRVLNVGLSWMCCNNAALQSQIPEWTWCDLQFLSSVCLKETPLQAEIILQVTTDPQDTCQIRWQRKKPKKLLFKSYGGSSVLDFSLFYLTGGKIFWLLSMFLSVPGETSKLHLLEKDCKVESLAFMVDLYNQPYWILQFRFFSAFWTDLFTGRRNTEVTVMRKEQIHELSCGEKVCTNFPPDSSPGAAFKMRLAGNTDKKSWILEMGEHM